MFPLSPRSIAVIGASADKKKLGAMILDNLLTQGFRGNVFPVNPKGGSIDGREAMKSVTDIKEEIDIAVIATPAATVNDIARECAAKKVKALVVISAGFAETHDPADRAREEELKAICDEADMHLVGPNCLGMLIPPLTLNASFAAGMPHAGSVALLMQSGALAVAIMDKARSLDLGFSIVVSMGNKAAMDECDFLEIVERDEHTGVIGLYVEGVRDGVRLRRIASRIAKTRPIVLLKSGTSERGKRAVSSHTGALAGSDSAIAALCQQTGMHRARSTEEFLLLLRTFSTQPELSTSRIAIITNAGGPGVLATDAAEREKLELAPLMKKTTDVLDAALPSAANKENPIDLLGDALADRYEAALQACIDDPNVDGIAVLLTPQVMTPSRDIARTVIAAKKRASLMPIVTSFIGGPSIADAERMLHEAHIPNFSDPESALHALSALRTRKRDEEENDETDGTDDNRATAARALIGNHTGPMNEEDAVSLLSLYDIPTPDGIIAHSEEEAMESADAIGYPVIAKVSSPDILHKSDIGGVKLPLTTNAQVKKAFAEIRSNVAAHAPAAALRGVLIQKLLPPGHEFLVGAVRDPSFGPLIAVGLGGVYTEIMRDVATRIAPLSKRDAYEMLRSLRAWPMLLGTRGEKELNIAALAEIIMRIATLMLDCPAISELDLNPVLVTAKDVTVADAKIIIKTQTTIERVESIPSSLL